MATRAENELTWNQPGVWTRGGERRDEQADGQDDGGGRAVEASCPGLSIAPSRW